MGYGYYRNYHQRPAVLDRATGHDISERLGALLKSEDVPQNTKGFVQSLSDAYEKYKGLTSRQFEAFEKVEKRFSADKIAARKSWAGEYTEERRHVAKICAEYYLANPPYFRDLADSVVNREDFVPTERQWRALCENKYAKKVLEAALATPKYLNGSMVVGRATAGRNIRGKFLLVIEANASPVKSAAKGSKIYRVLPVGSPSTILVEEREIKRSSKKKK
jgi:hypothetical protein